LRDDWEPAIKAEAIQAQGASLKSAVGIETGK
jgi:hypothetical protein